jgi:hypothetical protein
MNQAGFSELGAVDTIRHAMKAGIYSNRRFLLYDVMNFEQRGNHSPWRASL